MKQIISKFVSSECWFLKSRHILAIQARVSVDSHHIFVYSEKAGRQTASPQKTVNVTKNLVEDRKLRENSESCRSSTCSLLGAHTLPLGSFMQSPFTITYTPKQPAPVKENGLEGKEKKRQCTPQVVG